MDRWWANCIRNDEERRRIGEVIATVRSDKTFVFTRDMYERALERRKETGMLSFDKSGPSDPDAETREESL